MFNRLSTEYLARASASKPKRVIGIWAALVVVAVGLVLGLFESAVTTEFAFLNDPESKKASAILEEGLRGPADVREVVIIRSPDLIVDDPSYREYTEQLYSTVKELGDDVVADVTHYYKTRDESLVSKDRHYD